LVRYDAVLMTMLLMHSWGWNNSGQESIEGCSHSRASHNCSNRHRRV